MFKTILMLIDADQENSSSRSLPVAEQISKDYGAKLHAISDMPTMGISVVGSFFPPDFEDTALASAQEKLSEVLANAASNPTEITTHVAHGTIYEEVLSAADKLGCERIVMTSHPPELKDYLIGSNAAHVICYSAASTPVSACPLSSCKISLKRLKAPHKAVRQVISII